MHAEDLLIDDGSNGEAIEAIGEGLPKFDVVSPFAFVIKSINAINRCTFVISSQNEEIFWIFYLVGEKKTNGFETLFSAINIVS